MLPKVAPIHPLPLSPLPLPPQRVTDTGIQSLCEGCSELESLSISNCDTLTDLSLKKIATHCHNLRYIHNQTT